MAITRIVKLSFKSEKVRDFLQLFANSKEKIRSFEGCFHLELLQDVHHPNVYFTLSKWDSNAALERYRNSKLFKETWAKTKIHFDQAPITHSMVSVTTTE